MPVIVAKINGTKNDIPKAFKIINDNLPTVDIKHLRRIKTLPDGQLDCIICKLKSSDKKHHDEELKQVEQKFASGNIFTNYRITHVPSKAPKTNQQLQACSEIWPCKFAKSNYLISCMQGSLFTEPERLVLKIIVHDVLKFIESERNNKIQSAAVVFRCAKVYGVGLTSSHILARNPSQHSTMASIDAVAANAGGGHWRCQKGRELHENIQKELDKQEELQQHRIDANFLPYLCTNYDIFVTEEPCLMCTMGLVQSRIRRLFFLDQESNKFANCRQFCYPDSAIEEIYIHRQKNLNHRFEAWRVTIVPEAVRND